MGETCHFLTALGTRVITANDENEFYWENPDGKQAVCRTAYVQLASLVHFALEEGKRWDEIEIGIFCTKDAKNANWDGTCAELGKFPEIMRERYGREDFQTPNIKLIEIPLGSNQGQQQEIFNLIYQEIGQAETVFFDITNGLRSIPVLAITGLNYARATKSCKIGGISYGNFDGRDGNDKKEKRVPLIDLTYLSAILEWTGAAESFLGSEEAGGLPGSLAIPWYGITEE